MCKSERVLWIDIYKALAIVLVVVGHSTGKLLDNIDVKKNATFVCRHSLKGVIEDDNSEIEIVFKFNSEHQPNQDSADKRALSGMIKSIYID